MAKTKFNYPIESIGGSINKTTFRKKHFKDEDGKVLGEGAQEAYIITNPRDWKKNPPKGAELRKIELWKQTCAQTKMIIRNPEDIKDDTATSTKLHFSYIFLVKNLHISKKTCNFATDFENKFNKTKKGISYEKDFYVYFGNMLYRSNVLQNCLDGEF